VQVAPFASNWPGDPEVPHLDRFSYSRLDINANNNKTKVDYSINKRKTNEARNWFRANCGLVNGSNKRTASFFVHSLRLFFLWLGFPTLYRS